MNEENKREIVQGDVSYINKSVKINDDTQVFEFDPDEIDPDDPNKEELKPDTYKPLLKVTKKPLREEADTSREEADKIMINTDKLSEDDINDCKTECKGELEDKKEGCMNICKTKKQLKIRQNEKSNQNINITDQDMFDFDSEVENINEETEKFLRDKKPDTDKMTEKEKNAAIVLKIKDILNLLRDVGYSNYELVKKNLIIIYKTEKLSTKFLLFDLITNVLEKLINQYNTTRSFGIGKYLWGKKKLHKRINQLFEDVKNNPNMYTQYENEYVKKLIRDVKGGKTRKLKKYRNISKRKNTRNRNISKRKNNF